MADEKKESKEGLYNIGTSIIIDPTIRRLAEKIGKILEPYVPESGLWRDVTERSLAGLTAWLETLSKSKSAIPAIILEKLTDLFDKTGQALFRESGKDGKPRKEAVIEVIVWMDQFFKTAGERLSKIQDINALDAEFKKIEKELDMRLKLAKRIEKAKPKPKPEPEAEPEKEKKPLVSDEIKKGVEEIRDKHAEWMEKRIQTLKERKW